MAATFGRASDFLSEADLLRFRGLTNLLRATNGIDDRAQQGGLGFIHDNENSKNNVLYRRLAEFDDLLVRHLEVVAVRSADKNGTLVQILTDPDRDDDETGDNSPELDDEGDAIIGHVYYTANPDPETDKNKGNKKKGMENRVAPLLVEIIAEPAEPMDSAGAWLLKHTTGTKRKAPKTSITLDKHGSMLVSLITATHEASDRDALRTTKARLHNYVLLASIAKIRGRIIRGTAQHDRNLWEFLTKQSTDVHTAPGTEKDIPFQPSNAKGMKIPGLLLRKILASLKKSKTGLAPELEPWLERTDEVEYTNDTRPVFQTLLSGLLIAVNAALLDLVNNKHERLMDKGKGKLSEEQVANAALELDRYAATASQWLRLLSALLDKVRPVVQAHLLYLKDVFAITKVRDREKQRRELNAPPSSYSADAPSSDRLGQPSSEPGPYQSSSSDSGLGDLESGLEKTVISKKEAYTADFEEIDSAGFQQNWDLAALKYMDLLCLHQKAVNSLGKGSGDTHDKKTHNFLRAARFEYVRCFQDQADGNMMSMRKVMETLKSPSGNEIGPDSVTKIKAFIQKHETTKDGKPVISDTKWEDEKSFDGNFHCETLMLSLQLLHKTQAARDEVSSDEKSENSYLLLPSKDIVDSFADPAKVLPVSKRCCPACHALMKYVNEDADEKILYPGHHENWFTAALPPWLPRKAGMAVIKAAETKLGERVKEYLKSGTPLSDSSTGTSPITSHREDDLEDIDPDGIPTPADWSKDQGEKRKRRGSEEESDASRSSSPTKRRQEM
ncbi:hypothetical protein P171DRAFT_431266 [Karstenula rhodostoma CBS 690.94]|uniref:Uncharacterized protein n=1 Tax=Karstenula rhodostoma CBS 690.94 TaxID=1392251 RepID=A0A9P4PKV8_9PLEO|nr:hypothetical protein P171DRAFT_431266 [Karstenula rhodostoma CBS 690.94]